MRSDSIIDIKQAFMSGIFFAITFADCEMAMKIISFLVAVGYTVHRWIIMIKQKKSE